MQRVTVGLFASVAFAVAAGGAWAQSKDPIKIGVLYPITGTGAVYGVPAMQGHDLAVEELNAKGGILGRKVVSVARDDKLNPADASAAAKEVITNEKVDVLIGGLASSVGLAISDVAKQEQIVYISTIPKTIQMTTDKLHPWVFRTASNTDFEGDAMAQIVKQIGGKKICDVALDYAYGHDLSAGIKKALPKHAPDAQIVLEVKPKLGATDYNAFITQILGAGCDTITSSMWGNHFINFAKQATPFGLFQKVKFIGGGEVASHEVASKMGADYPDNVWSNTYELWYHSPTEMHKKFQAALAKKAGTQETSMWPMLAYNGVMFYAAAVEKAGSTDKEAVRKALEGLTIDTPVGKLTIDAKTHQANTGQFWGPMKKKDGVSYRVMDPITFVTPPAAGS
jgi:branched-chain amino acid transport system substrate-binding protein